jgi:hypothetical protein
MIFELKQKTTLNIPIGHNLARMKLLRASNKEFKSAFFALMNSAKAHKLSANHC